MSRFSIDFEFSEGFCKTFSWLPSFGPFNKKRWKITLISIGIKSYDGRTYYAVNRGFKRSECNEWVRKNVLPMLPPRYVHFDEFYPVLYTEPNQPLVMLNPLYKSISEIREDILKFMVPFPSMTPTYEFDEQQALKYIARNPPQFVGYFSAYDWVLFCTIFGAMNDLPNGFPMYCYDLKQEIDRLATLHSQKHGTDFQTSLACITGDDNYPVMEEGAEHDALQDAHWNMRLDRFLNQYEETL